MNRVIRTSSKNFLLDISYIYLIICQASTDGEKNGPKFVEPIPNVTVTVGRDASLPCVISNLGAYKVIWIHIDRQMVVTMHKHVISRVPRYSISVRDENTWILHVTRVQQEDRGYYMCQVNTNPIISQVGYLQVTVPPEFIDNDSTSTATVVVRENQNLTLSCQAQGFPTPKIAWKREDGMDIVLNRRIRGPVFSGEFIHFERVTRTDMAGYLCIAANGVPPALIKKIFINVEFSPMIFVPNQLIASTVASNITLECQTEANPAATTYWLHKGRLVTQNTKYRIHTAQNSYRTYTKLEIRNVSKDEFNEYTCLSKNPLGETEGTVRLYGTQYVPPTTAESIVRTTLPIPFTKSTVIAKINENLYENRRTFSHSLDREYGITEVYVHPKILHNSSAELCNSKLATIVLLIFIISVFWYH